MRLLGERSGVCAARRSAVGGGEAERRERARDGRAREGEERCGRRRDGEDEDERRDRAAGRRDGRDEEDGDPDDRERSHGAILLLAARGVISMGSSDARCRRGGVPLHPSFTGARPRFTDRIWPSSRISRKFDPARGEDQAAKRTLRGGRGSFNAALFYMDISDLQATVTAGSCSSRVIFNVPKAESSGVEVELEMAPNDNFDFAISASRTNSELRSTLTSTDAQGNVSVVAGIEEGRRLPTVPEIQLAAAASYRREIGSGLVGYGTAAYQHVGDRYTQIGDQAAGFGTVNLLSFSPNDIGGPFAATTFTFDPKLPAYDIVNLRLGVLVGQWDTALFINNATDERAFLALDQERGTRARVGYLTNSPRTIGISTRVHF